MQSIKGNNGLVTLYEDRVIIKKTFGRPVEFRYEIISSIDYRRPTKKQNGYIRFLTGGLASPVTNLRQIANDPNAIILIAFTNATADATQAGYAYALSRMNASKVSPTVVPISSISVADELFKLKELVNAGVLTQDEFDAQKQALLSS